MNSHAQGDVHYDVVIIGAGPAGSVAASLLLNDGYRVGIIEKDHFPRFTIGESLLPQSMEILEEAGLLGAVIDAAPHAGFQYKTGATFVRGDQYEDIDFSEKVTHGWATTYQVRRAEFDQLLAEQVQSNGAIIHWGCQVEAVETSEGIQLLKIKDSSDDRQSITARFIIDASGQAQVLARLLGLDRPSIAPPREAFFQHIDDHIDGSDFDREHILIGIDPEHESMWQWLIPFADGRSSVGAVAPVGLLNGNSREGKVAYESFERNSGLAKLLVQADWSEPEQVIRSYASRVDSMWGAGYVLIGNSSGFMDPIFSSGVTIAFKSASLACMHIHRYLQGETVDWQVDYEDELSRGLRVFEAFIESWYVGDFQRLLFYPRKDNYVKRCIASVLAGYAWDKDNPFVEDARRRLAGLMSVVS